MKTLIFLGPPIIAQKAGTRHFLIIAHDNSCHVEFDVDEPWMSEDEIRSRLSGGEALDHLMQWVARHVRRNGGFSVRA